MNAPPATDALVIGLHLRWPGVRQRPHHIAVRLAQHCRVLVVEEPLLAVATANPLRAADNLTVLVPERSGNIVDVVDDATLEAVRSFIGGDRAAFWLYSPLLLPLVDAQPTAPIIYDKMDELAAFDLADARIPAREGELLKRATIVFAGGRSLWESVRERARAGGAYASGVDFDHYAHAGLDGRARTGERPVFGYVGVIDERLDLDLIATLAAARPDALVMLAGPVAKIGPASLPRAANIVYLGARSYGELPALMAGFDVALMPFALNAATRFISPTKTLEYLAAGLPVVSTPVHDVVADFSDVVTVADRQNFVAAVARAERRDPEQREAGRRRASAMSWDAIVARMLDDLARAGIVFSR